MPEADTVVASPCNSVCTMDPRTGWCEGCQRTLDEIAAWATLDNEQKLAVWDALAQRGRSQQARASAGPLPSGPDTPAGGGCGTPQPGVP